MEPKNVKKFWDVQAENPELAEDSVTIKDRFQRKLEIDVLLQYLPRQKRVVDIGCGNGYTTSKIAPFSEFVLGLDYSEPMILRAKEQFGNIPNIEFQVQNVLSMNPIIKGFDVAVSQRCLINLESWDSQKKAIRNIAKVIKPGGIFILQEGTKQGREKLNQIRETLKLNRMPDVAYNNDFDENLLWPFIRGFFEIVDIRRFGIYDLISRVTHPILVAPEEPKYDARINETAYKIAKNLRGNDEISRVFSAFLKRLD